MTKAYRAGDWLAICDMCGFRFYASELKENWKGQRVCSKDFETRHPQEFIRPRLEQTSVPWTRPDPDVMDPIISWTTSAGWQATWHTSLNLPAVWIN